MPAPMTMAAATSPIVPAHAAGLGPAGAKDPPPVKLATPVGAELDAVAPAEPVGLDPSESEILRKVGEETLGATGSETLGRLGRVREGPGIDAVSLSAAVSVTAGPVKDVRDMTAALTSLNSSKRLCAAAEALASTETVMVVVTRVETVRVRVVLTGM